MHPIIATAAGFMWQHRIPTFVALCAATTVSALVDANTAQKKPKQPDLMSQLGRGELIAVLRVHEED